MVTLTGPALSTPIDFAQSSVAALALDRLKQRPVPTEAQAEALVTLDSVRAEMKEAPKKAAAAKVDYLRSKLDAIKLADLEKDSGRDINGDSVVGAKVTKTLVANTLYEASMNGNTYTVMNQSMSGKDRKSTRLNSSHRT